MTVVPGLPYLLDTNVVLGVLVAPATIAPAVRDGLMLPSVQLQVSAVSAWEIATKTWRGKLPGGEGLLAAWDISLRDLAAEPLVIDHADAIRAGALPWEHRDPFDRMLVAQALRHNVGLVTRDRAILAAGMVATVDARA